MALQQQSLFDFFEHEPAPKPETRKLVPPKIEEQTIVVNEEPVEVDFEPEKIEEIIPEHSFAYEESYLKDEAIAAKKSGRGRPKLTDADLHFDPIEIPEDEILFTRKYYSIGLVASMFKVNVSLIRFWEKEFDALKPKLNGKGDRHFRPEDVKTLKQIHHLLREKKYTIEGAKDFLKKNKKADESFLVVEELQKLKAFLVDLKLSL